MMTLLKIVCVGDIVFYGAQKRVWCANLFCVCVYWFLVTDEFNTMYRYEINDTFGRVSCHVLYAGVLKDRMSLVGICVEWVTKEKKNLMLFSDKETLCIEIC